MSLKSKSEISYHLVRASRSCVDPVRTDKSCVLCFKSCLISSLIRYKRIPVDRSKGTDPLSGLVLGSFGPHGPELLNLTRTIIDGEEVVQAMKLTGDANVPAGSVSFRAKTGRKHRLEARDVYPDELGIMARCGAPLLKGQSD